jgi:hypothetical protein
VTRSEPRKPERAPERLAGPTTRDRTSIGLTPLPWKPSRLGRHLGPAIGKIRTRVGPPMQRAGVWAAFESDTSPSLKRGATSVAPPANEPCEAECSEHDSDDQVARGRADTTHQANVMPHFTLPVWRTVFCVANRFATRF